MNGTHNTEHELSVHIGELIARVARELSDSPISRTHQIHSAIGFYKGYCVAKGWSINWNLIHAWNDRA